MKSVERVTVLLNPAAANGSGKHSWAHLRLRFEALFSGYKCQVVESKSVEHGIELGATAHADLLISAGGDGTINAIAQGMMQRPRDERPMLAMLPIGSGNDLARTLGIPRDPRRALEALSSGRRATIDVGRCNKNVFLETLSFGVDAAIALKTVELRKTSNRRGILLYASAAIPALIHDLKPHRFCIQTDKGQAVEDDLLICAVQNGPSYGGGFVIAPGAHINDGELNVCLALDTSTLAALRALALIARGRHEHLPFIRTMTARALTIDLEQELPAQCDGEPLCGTHFEIELVAGALDVLVPSGVVL
jgi:YegS/Rv2252/BmrU family lipid kinase